MTAPIRASTPGQILEPMRLPEKWLGFPKVPLKPELERHGARAMVPGSTLMIRRLRPDDAEAVSALYGACMATEPGIGPVSAAAWSDTIRLPQFGGGRDFLVAVEGGEPVGLAESSLRDGGPRPSRMVKILIHPGRRRHGVGTALLRAVLEQGPVGRSLVLEGFARADWPAGLAFLRRFGFIETETEIVMRCETLQPAPLDPAGILIGPVPDVEPVLERIAVIHNEAYRDDAGFVRTTAGDQRDLLRDARLWTASRAGEIVAFAKVEREPGLVWLESLAVLPNVQGAGFGEALARRALRGEGMDDGHPAGLSVSSRAARALRLYRRLGFTERSRKGRYSASDEDVRARMS